MPIKRRKISELKEAENLTGFFTIGYRVVDGVKESVKYGLAYIYATYLDMLQAIKDLRGLESTVGGNENTRKAAESGRVASENDRVTGEGGRVTAETSRVNAERNRVTAETGRVTEEGKRVTAESGRVSQENARASQENGRETAESGRMAEEGRRAGQEDARAMEEGKRVAAETSRADVEKTRVASETDRASQENTRVTQENARKTAEAGRVDAETARVSQEETREAAEAPRVSQENARVTQENGRKTAETGRATEEGKRVTAESGRVSSENARAEAETGRVAEFATLRRNAETATANANDTATHPTYIGADNYVYRWNAGTRSYDKMDIFVKGDAFSVKKTYPSIEAMNADVNNPGIIEGSFVLINTDNVGDPDNACLYVKARNEDATYSYSFLVDMSGAIGFTGKTPQFVKGAITTGEPGSEVQLGLSEAGNNGDGNPVYALNIIIPRGNPGSSFKVLDHFDTLGELKAVVPDGSAVDGCYAVGVLPFTYYAWYNGNWQSQGRLQGIDGKSAYRVAVDNGFVGTVNEWLISLVGADGANGAPGTDGTPCTHLWSGTTLTVTSASGTSSANLKGDKGDKGDAGVKGDKGDTSYAANSSNYANQLQAFTGDDFTGGNHFVKAIRDGNNWITRLWMCYENGAKQSDSVAVNHANSCSNADMLDGYHHDSFYKHDGVSAGWFRSAGASGWYSQDYGGGIYCTDSTFVRTYNGRAMAAAGGFWKESDRRLKSDIVPLGHTLEQLLSIPTDGFLMDGKGQIGTIAQEIERVCPEVVSESLVPKPEVPVRDDWETVVESDSEGNPREYVKVKRVEYEMLGVLAIEGLRLLNDKVENLKKQLEICQQN